MTGLPAREILRKMHKAKKKAIRRAERYHAETPSFNRGSILVRCADEDNEEERAPASVFDELENYIDSLEWDFRDRIAEQKSRKKQNKLLTQLRSIRRPCKIYFSAAALIVTRAIKLKGEQMKEERGEHWFHIRKWNARIIECACRRDCRRMGYTDADEEREVQEHYWIEDALRGKLPEDICDFEKEAHWFHYNRGGLPDYWWRWWNYEGEFSSDKHLAQIYRH